MQPLYALSLKRANVRLTFLVRPSYAITYSPTDPLLISERKQDGKILLCRQEMLQVGGRTLVEAVTAKW